MSKVSDCCNAPPRSIGNGDNDTETFGICGSCGDHCEYIEQEDETPEMPTRRGRDEDLKRISESEGIDALNNDPFISPRR